MGNYIGDLNLNAVQEWDGDGGFNPPAEGEYLFRVTSVEAEKSSKGNLMLTTKLEVIGLPDGGETAETGKEMTDWRSLKPVEACRKRIKALVTACEVEIDDKGGFDTDEFAGQEFIATVRHESYTKGGKTFENNPRISRERRA